MFKPLNIIGAASFFAGLAMIAGSGYHLTEFSVLLFGLALIGLILAITQYVRNNEFCKRFDAFQLHGERIYRAYIETQDSPQNKAMQIAWFNEIDKYLAEKKISERGSLKSARTDRTPLLPDGFSFAATQTVIQILGRQELLKDLKAKYRP